MANANKSTQLPLIYGQNNSRHLFKFDSQAEQLRYVESSNYKFDGKDFVGEDLPTWQAVETLAKGQWDIGTEAFNAYIERLSKVEIPIVKSTKRKFVWATEGDEIDVERAAAGEPKCWKKYTREKKSGPTSATIIVDTTTTCMVDSMDVLWRGASAIALLKVLEDKGYSVEFWVINGSTLYRDKGTKVMTTCCLKRTKDPLDIGTIINTVSGWFYRTETFTLLKTICEKRGERVEYGLGQAYYPNEDDIDQITTDKLRVYVTGVYSFSGAYDLIIEQLKTVFEGAANEGDAK